MSEQTNPTNGSLAEAPASWNTRYLSPEGFICQITLRANSGKELLEKAGSAIAFLLQNNCQPVEHNNRSRNSGGQLATSNNQNGNCKGNGNGESHICPIHNIEMRRWEKNGKVWYSHKTEDGSWCTGKSK